MPRARRLSQDALAASQPGLHLSCCCLPSAAVLRIGRDLAAAVQHLLSKGILLCDLKPSTILLDGGWGCVWRQNAICCHAQSQRTMWHAAACATCHASAITRLPCRDAAPVQRMGGCGWAGWASRGGLRWCSANWPPCPTACARCSRQGGGQGPRAVDTGVLFCKLGMAGHGTSCHGVCQRGMP